jgi:hypothetical protein
MLPERAPARRLLIPRRVARRAGRRRGDLSSAGADEERAAASEKHGAVAAVARDAADEVACARASFIFIPLLGHRSGNFHFHSSTRTLKQCIWS